MRELAGYSIGHVPSELGSGGMRSKVVAAEMATAAGIPATICSGLRDGVLARALAGEAEGTRFAAQEQRHSSFELWLKYAKPASGSVVVDAGAARALREGGASLLPVGVVEVEGAFGEGDAIEIRDAAARWPRGSRRTRPRCAPRDGAPDGGGARAAAARGRRGRASRLPRAALSAALRFRAWRSRASPSRRSTQCAAAKRAARGSRRPTAATRDAALHAIANALEERTPEILEANARDMEAGAEAGLSDALLDRLRLDADRIRGIADGARDRSRRCPIPSAR